MGLEQLRRALRAGYSWRAACREAGLPLTTGYRRATRQWPELAGRRPRLTAEKREAIAAALAEGAESYRAIARRLGCSPDTVSRAAYAQVVAELARESLEPVARARPRRCEQCGAKIATRECLACQLRHRPS